MLDRVSTLAILAAMTAALTQPAAADAIDNGTVQIGVNPQGNLVSGGIGLVFLPQITDTNPADALSPGCACEGWGVADLMTGAFGMAGETFGDRNLGTPTQTTTGTGTLGTSDGSATRTLVRVTDGAFELDVEHEFTPSSAEELYQVDVTMTNQGGAEVGNLVYRRAMDWDVPPTEFAEFVTIQGWPASRLIASSDNGFQTGDPNVALTTIAGDAVANGNFTDSGPADHGAVFDFSFGELAAGAEEDFTIFYGAAASEDDALAALSEVGAEIYSLGQPSGPDGAELGVPNTFIFGFAGVGGTPIGGTPVTDYHLNPIGDLTLLKTERHLNVQSHRFDMLGLAFGEPDISTQGPAVTANGLTLRFSGLYASGDVDKTTNNVGLDYTSRFIGFGADYDLGPTAGFENALIGGAFSFDKTKADRKDNRGSFNGDTRTFSLHFAGANTVGVFADGQIFRANHDFDQTRIGLMNTFTSSPEAQTTGVRMRLGYNFGPEILGETAAGTSQNLGLYGELTRSRTAVDSFAENNGGLTTDAFDIDSNLLALGARYSFETRQAGNRYYGAIDMAVVKDLMADDYTVTQRTAGGSVLSTAVDGRDDMQARLKVTLGYAGDNGTFAALEGGGIFGGNGHSEASIGFKVGMNF